MYLNFFFDIYSHFIKLNMQIYNVILWPVVKEVLLKYSYDMMVLLDCPIVVEDLIK